MRENFLTSDLSISGILSKFGFCGRKAPPAPISGDFEHEGNFFWLWIYPFQAILSKFGFCGRKAPPPAWGKIFWLWIYPFQAILSNFGFCGRKAPPPGWGKIFDFGSIHFRQFWATLLFVAEKETPTPEKPPRMREKFLTLDLSISGDFEQVQVPPLGEILCCSRCKAHWISPPPPGWGKFFWLWIYPFQVILSKFGFCGRKAPPPQDEGKFFDFGSIHFRQFWASVAFVAREALPLRMREIFLTLDLSISGDFEQVWFLVAESPPPQDEGKFFDFGSIHFRWFWASLVFVAEKPPPRMREKILTLDLSISGNFEQVWFLWQKSPPPLFCLLVRYLARVAAHDVTSRTDILMHHCITLVMSVAEKPPPPGWGKFFDFGLSISGNFEQLCFLWQKSPPPGWGKIFWLWIYPFQAILSNFGFCGRKAPHPPPRMREIFLTLDLSISGDFEQVLFLWQKSPPPHPQDEGKFFDFGSIHFRWFWASLVFVAEKPSPPTRWGKNFWLWIYLLQAILSKFGFCGRKAPPPLFCLFGEILGSCCSTWHNFTDWYFMHHWISHWWWVGRKAPPPEEENFFDFRFIHFRQFRATLVFVAEKPPSPTRMRENFLTLDLSISGDFEQVWFLCRKGAPSFLPFGEILGSCCSTWCNFTDWYFMHHWISH